MHTFTFLCDWKSPVNMLVGAPFVVTVHADTRKKAEHAAATAVLAHCPDVALYETPATFFDQTGQILAAFDGPVPATLIDRDVYETIPAPAEATR
ncbi:MULTISPECIES: hypothetical protein [unclassified Streptomyces]|uniref:hypothetical protein n=1 Tax=unclassified Streptomyces TaxID=2593676 RepID=UPI003BB5028B